MIAATTNYKNALAAYRAGALYWAVEIAGFSRVLTTQVDGVAGHYPWLVGLDDYSITINELDGGADLGTFVFRAQDVGGALTAAFPSFTFEGKLVTVKQGFAGLAYADYATFFTGYVDSVDSDNNNAEYAFNCHDGVSKLSNVVYLTGDDGIGTSSDHRRTVSGHPFDIITDVIETQLGLSAGSYNKAKLQAYRDGIFTGMKFVFHLDQPPAAADFIKAQILKPLLGYMWCRADGVVDFNFAYPNGAIASVQTLGPGSWTSIPTAEQTDLVDIATFQFDKNDGSITISQNIGSGTSTDYLAVSVQEYAAAISKYGQFADQTVPCDGVRSTYGGFTIAAIGARMLFQKYGSKALKFDQAAADSLWQSCLLEPGDIVAVTHPKIPDRAAGVMGVTGKLFEVVNKTVKFMEGLVVLTMMDASYLSSFGQYLIAPDGTLDYASESPTNKGKYMFMTNDSGLYSNSDTGHGLG